MSFPSSFDTSDEMESFAETYFLEVSGTHRWLKVTAEQYPYDRIILEAEFWHENDEGGKRLVGFFDIDHDISGQDLYRKILKANKILDDLVRNDAEVESWVAGGQPEGQEIRRDLN